MTIGREFERRITVVCKWSPPDPAPIGYIMDDIIQYLIKNSWRVSVINGNSLFCLFFSKLFKLSIFSRNFEKLMSLLIFSLYSFIKLLFIKKGEVVFVVSQPMTQFILATWAVKFRRGKLIFNIQDLHPDALEELGVVRNKIVLNGLKKVEAYGYRQADQLTVISTGFARHCIALGAKDERVHVIPNWINLLEVVPEEADSDYAKSLGVDLVRPIVLYAGSLSKAAQPNDIIHVALEVSKRDPSVQFLIVGDGSMKEYCQKIAIELGVNNVIFQPFRPREELSKLQALSTVSIITMKSGQGKNSVPSKIYGYMSAGKPIIAAVDETSETSNIIMEAQCGWVTPAEDHEKMANAILSALYDNPEYFRIGLNGRKFIEKHNNPDIVLRRYMYLFESVDAAGVPQE